MDHVLVNGALVNTLSLGQLNDEELSRLRWLVEDELDRRDNMPSVKGAPWPDGDGKHNPNAGIVAKEMQYERV